MHTGRCHCGKVRYTSRGAPLFSLICYCRDCQKASGTAGVPVMGVPKAEFEVVGATHATRATRTIGTSGKAGIRHLCAECGSLLFGTPEVAPDLVTLYVGSLDVLEDFHPTTAIFTRSRPAWATLRRDLIEFEGAPQ